MATEIRWRRSEYCFPLRSARGPEKMEEMYQADHFFILEQDLPCCGKTVSFNQLRYSRPCGFSCLAFLLRNPKVPVGQEVVDQLSERFGLLFRKIETDL